MSRALWLASPMVASSSSCAPFSIELESWSDFLSVIMGDIVVVIVASFVAIIVAIVGGRGGGTRGAVAVVAAEAEQRSRGRGESKEECGGFYRMDS